jgi:hypothetical protein
MLVPYHQAPRLFASGMHVSVVAARVVLYVITCSCRYSTLFMLAAVLMFGSTFRTTWRANGVTRRMFDVVATTVKHGVAMTYRGGGVIDWLIGVGVDG